MNTNNLDDHDLDARATAYAAKYGASYMDALRAVVASFGEASGATVNSFGERSMGARSEDHRLDAAASDHVRRTGSSYIDALKHCHAANVSFSEARASGSISPAESLQSKGIEIFKAGVHTADDGQQRTFSHADIAATARAYDPKLREAPMTVGHPATDLPAYGWIKRLEATADGRLMMFADQVDPGFAKNVLEGRFKKRSASFYSPAHPNNPKPGVWYVKHVGWLGAQQPAVAGLRDHQFAQTIGAVSFSA